MHIILQIAFISLWITGLIVLVIGVWYAVSWLVLVAVSKLIPLIGPRPRDLGSLARDHRASVESPDALPAATVPDRSTRRT